MPVVKGQYPINLANACTRDAVRLSRDDCIFLISGQLVHFENSVVGQDYFLSPFVLHSINRV
jgi:hypothetical protein